METPFSNPYESRIAERVYDDKHADRKKAKEYARRYNRHEAQSIFKDYTWYCSNCRKDFDGLGVKSVQSIAGELPIVFYRIRHSCGKDCIRRETGKPDDEYYNLSDDIRLQRQTFRDDTLSPYQNRFKVLYEDTGDIDRERENSALEEAVWTKHAIEGAASSRSRAYRDDLAMMRE